MCLSYLPHDTLTEIVNINGLEKRELDPPARKSYEEYMENDEKDHLEILLEAIQGDVQHVVEATDSHTEQLNALGGAVGAMQETLGQVKDDVDAIKTTLEQVNLVEMKQEIIDLKKRMEVLESRAGK